MTLCPNEGDHFNHFGRFLFRHVVGKGRSEITEELTMRNIVVAACLLPICFGIALADEFQAIITKVEGKKVTFNKTKKGEKGIDITLENGGWHQDHQR